MLASLYEKGKFYTKEAEVLDEAEKAAGSAKDKMSVYFMRGAMWERQKKIDLAEAQFRKVLAIDPEHAGALNYLGYMLVDHGMRVDEATSMIKKALEIEPDNGAYLDSLGWAYYQQGKFDEAEPLLLRADRQDRARTRRSETIWPTSTSSSAKLRKLSLSGRRL